MVPTALPSVVSTALLINHEPWKLYHTQTGSSVLLRITIFSHCICCTYTYEIRISPDAVVMTAFAGKRHSMPGNPGIDGNALPSPLLAIVVVCACAASRAASSHSILTGMYCMMRVQRVILFRRQNVVVVATMYRVVLLSIFFHICDNCAHFCRVDFFPSQM